MANQYMFHKKNWTYLHFVSFSSLFVILNSTIHLSLSFFIHLLNLRAFSQFVWRDMFFDVVASIAYSMLLPYIQKKECKQANNPLGWIIFVA